jgi:serine/threonine protein kinase
VPKKSSLTHRLRTDDVFFLDFVRNLLNLDPQRRPTAVEAMKHPWFTKMKYPDGL